MRESFFNVAHYPGFMRADVSLKNPPRTLLGLVASRPRPARFFCGRDGRCSPQLTGRARGNCKAHRLGFLLAVNGGLFS